MMPFARLCVALVGTVLLAVGIGWATLRPPLHDLQDLALFLLVSGGVSLAFGYAMLGLAAWFRRGGIGLKLTLGGTVGVLVAFINILFTALLMFISAHDLGLLLVLLFFSGLLASVFSLELARSMS